MKAIILAAGIGERMRPLTDNTPKPMLQINKKPIIEYLIRLFKKHNIKDIRISVFYLKEQIINHLKNREDLGVNISYLKEEELIPSGKAIKQMISFIEKGEQVIITNGDNITDIDLDKLINFHNKKNAEITIVSYLRRPDQPPSSQLDFNENMKLLNYRERLTQKQMELTPPKDRRANMGLYIFNRNVLETIQDDEQSNIGDMFPFFLGRGFNIYVYHIPEENYFKEVGKMERFNKAKQEIEQGEIKLDYMDDENPNKEEDSSSNHSLKLDKLELGSGERPSQGYLHQDVIELQGIELDFKCNPWEVDIPPGSLSEVLALGVMEHLRYEDFKKTLAHIHQVLKKGGEFLFDVPDMKIWAEYLYNLTHNRKDKNPFPPKHIWSTVYGWQRWPGDEHKSGWTREMLLDVVRESGFSQIEEGVQIFTSKGIQRGRFTRPGDAHIYIKAIK